MNGRGSSLCLLFAAWQQAAPQTCRPAAGLEARAEDEQWGVCSS